MSTRSQIVLVNKDENGNYKPTGCLYHHFDGYIEDGVGQELAEAMERDGFRGVCDMMLNDKGYEDEVSESEESTLTWDSLPKHGDIEYLYFVDESEPSIKVLRGRFFDAFSCESYMWDYTNSYVQEHLEKLVMKDGAVQCVPNTPLAK